MEGFFLFHYYYYYYFTLKRSYSYASLYTLYCHTLPPQNQTKLFFYFTSCTWKELTLCLENAHKCVKYSCVTQRFFYKHTAALADHVFRFSLYSVQCLTCYFIEASESCVVIE